MSFRSTVEVSRILWHDYKLMVLPKDLGRYDATRGYYVGGAALAELFHATRARAIDDISQIPIAHLAYRLRSLQRMAEDAELAEDFKLAARLIEQAAKEAGGCYVKARPGTEANRPPAAPAAQACPAQPKVEPAATDPDPAGERDAAQPRPPEALPPTEASNATESDERARPAGNPGPGGSTKSGLEPSKPEPGAPDTPDAGWDTRSALSDRVAGVGG